MKFPTDSHPLLFILTLISLHWPVGKGDWISKQASEEYIVSEHPMVWPEADDWCKAKNCKLANLTGETAGDAASIALASFLGPVSLWCGFASLESKVPKAQPVFHVWDNMFYGPTVADEEDKNYVICQRKAIALPG